MVRRIAQEKQTAVVLVEQHVQMALGAADRAIVLAHGSLVISKSAKELRADPELHKEAYSATPHHDDPEPVVPMDHARPRS